MGVFNDTLHKGHFYMKLWPMRKELAAIFPENSIITATKIGIKVMPALAVLSIAMQIQLGSMQQLPVSLALALLFITLPIQGLFWLGKRAGSRLPVALASWYRQLYQDLLREGCELEPAVKHPRYEELAHVLRNAFNRMDKVFINR